MDESSQRTFPAVVVPQGGIKDPAKRLYPRSDPCTRKWDWQNAGLTALRNPHGQRDSCDRMPNMSTVASSGLPAAPAARRLSLQSVEDLVQPVPHHGLPVPGLGRELDLAGLALLLRECKGYMAVERHRWRQEKAHKQAGSLCPSMLLCLCKQTMIACVERLCTYVQTQTFARART